MILVDANILVYAHVREMSQHARSRQWLDEKLNGGSRVGLPWPSLLAFLRLVTNPRVFDRPEPLAGAWRQVEEWLALENVWIPAPTARHQEILARLLPEAEGDADLIPDADLAAVAIEHGLILCSADGDFSRFSGLRWENPLRPSSRV